MFVSKRPCKLEGSLDVLSNHRGAKLIDVRQFVLNAMRIDPKLLKAYLPDFESEKWTEDELLVRMKANDITLLDPDQCWMRFIRKIPCHYNSVQEMSEPTTILQAFEKADRSYDNESVQLFVYADYVKPNSRVEFLRYTCDGLLISQDFLVPAVRKEALPSF